MNCKDVEEGDISELYLLERLPESERDEFEKHYFGCESCFSQLQTGLMLQVELQRQPLKRAQTGGALWLQAWVWTPALAAVVLLFAVGIWWYSIRRQPSQQVFSQPAKTSPETTAQPQPPSAAASSLEELARVEAPPYSATVLRDAEDESDEAFRKAMERYLKGDYVSVIPGLHAAAQTSPQSPKINFYLGACYLLTNRTDLAIEALRKTIAIGDTAYSEQAHFYLAKAYLKKRQLFEAKAELQQTVRLSGDRKIEAEEILRQLPE
jgi:tetratricopeptide (TPR) repeat protein